MSNKSEARKLIEEQIAKFAAEMVSTEPVLKNKGRVDISSEDISIFANNKDGPTVVLDSHESIDSDEMPLDDEDIASPELDKGVDSNDDAPRESSNYSTAAIQDKDAISSDAVDNIDGFCLHKKIPVSHKVFKHDLSLQNPLSYRVLFFIG